MKFLPETLGFRFLLKPDIMKESKGGIVIATSERRQAIDADKGVIVGIGPEAFKALKVVNPYKVGDKVIYAKYGAKVIKDDDTDDLYILCNDEDILVGYADE